MSRLAIAAAVCVLLLAAPVAVASAGFYTVQWDFVPPFGPSLTVPAGLTCTTSPTPAPEVEARCTPTFAATVCKSPSATADVLGFNTALIVRSICGPGAQADCTASATGFTLSASCTDDEPTLGETLTQFVCNPVPSGGIVRGTATCTAFIG